MPGFNPRPRMGGDGLILRLKVMGLSFNPRPRMGGDYIYSYPRNIIKGFNPRPRMGGDELKDAINAMNEVSIHAPAWGAT